MKHYFSRDTHSYGLFGEEGNAVQVPMDDITGHSRFVRILLNVRNAVSVRILQAEGIHAVQTLGTAT